MNLTLAKSITGGLSVPSKMPCYGFSIPAQACKIGSLLRKLKGSVCSICYALKGRYMFKNVKEAQARRLANLEHPLWVEAMIYQISKRESSGYFRWHDAGDLQDIGHLRRIIEVCKFTPQIKHWLPTREYGIVSDYVTTGGVIPDNLCVRLSAYMIDGKSPTSIARRLGVCTSGVTSDGFTCPAPTQGNECKSCRACWQTKCENVNYKKH